MTSNQVRKKTVLKPSFWNPDDDLRFPSNNQFESQTKQTNSFRHASLLSIPTNNHSVTSVGQIHRASSQVSIKDLSSDLAKQS